MTVAAKVQEPQAGPAVNLAEPETPEFESRHIQIDHCGQVSRSILVRSPKGMIQDDLRNPKIWRRVQAVPSAALIKLDRLMILAHDESWAAEAVVKFASNVEASLAITKVYAFRAVDEALYSDGNLEVFWDGSGYSVRRCSDKVPVSTGFSSEGLAIDALKKFYPRKAG